MSIKAKLVGYVKNYNVPKPIIYPSANDKLKDLYTDFADLKLKIHNIGELLKLYPDLKWYKGRWSDTFFTKSVNHLVTDYQDRSCEELFGIAPYLETEFGKVFSEPYLFDVGFGHYFPYPFPTYEDNLRYFNISETVINKLKD